MSAHPSALLFSLKEAAAPVAGGWERPGGDGATGGGASPIYVPAEEVVLHQHVLDALLQGLLLLLQQGQRCTRQGGRGPASAPPPSRKAGCWAQAQPPAPTSLFIGSSQSWERLKAKQQRTLGGGRGGCQVGSSRPLPPEPLGPEAQRQAGSSPELTLDLDPAGASQEGPGLVPLFHGRQAGAQHLQPQVQHLLAADRCGVGIHGIV